MSIITLIVASPSGRASIKILTLFILIPIFFSYNNVRSTLESYNLCFVGPTQPDAHTSNPLFGTYHSFDGAEYYFAKTPFDVSHTCLTPNLCGWPSATTMGSILSPEGIRKRKQSWKSSAKSMLEKGSDSYVANPSGTLSAYSSESPSEVISSSLFWDQAHSPLAVKVRDSRWCVASKQLENANHPGSTLEQYCTDNVPSVLADPTQSPFFSELPLNPPPRGSWGEGVEVECFLSKTDTNLMGGEAEKGEVVARVDWHILNLFGTLFLMVIHIFLYCKMNYKYSGWSDGEGWENFFGSYNSILKEGEIWKLCSSYFMHGSAGHLIWDLYNLYLIGAVLEGDYGTLTFLYLNLALMIMIGMATLLCFHIYSKIHSEDEAVKEGALASACLLGYSPVLFAWVIILSLKRDVFPIIPFSDVHIPTSGLLFLSVPAINILLAFVLLPVDKSAPFFSHIVGYLFGFLVHWNIPPRFLLSPDLMIPALMLVYLFSVKQYLPLKKAQGQQYSIILDADQGAGGAQPPATTHIKRPNQQGSVDILFNPRFIKFLHLLRFSMLLASIFSVMAFDHGMAISQFLISILFHFGVQSFLGKQQQLLNTGGLDIVTDTILRTYFVSSAVVLIMDAISVGAWCASHVFVLGNPQTSIGLTSVAEILMCRVLVNLFGIIVVARMIDKGDDLVGTLGSFFPCARTLGDVFVRCLMGKSRWDEEEIELIPERVLV